MCFSKQLDCGKLYMYSYETYSGLAYSFIKTTKSFQIENYFIGFLFPFRHRNRIKSHYDLLYISVVSAHLAANNNKISISERLAKMYSVFLIQYICISLNGDDVKILQTLNDNLIIFMDFLFIIVGHKF